MTNSGNNPMNQSILSETLNPMNQIPPNQNPMNQNPHPQSPPSDSRQHITIRQEEAEESYSQHFRAEMGVGDVAAVTVASVEAALIREERQFSQQASSMDKAISLLSDEITTRVEKLPKSFTVPAYQTLMDAINKFATTSDGNPITVTDDVVTTADFRVEGKGESSRETAIIYTTSLQIFVGKGASRTSLTLQRIDSTPIPEDIQTLLDHRKEQLAAFNVVMDKLRNVRSERANIDSVERQARGEVTRSLMNQSEKGRQLLTSLETQKPVASNRLRLHDGNIPEPAALPAPSEPSSPVDQARNLIRDL